MSSYVTLTKKGNRYWGLCPFHSEKTPSFSVVPDKQMCYCFGCHKGGGAVNFIMEMESVGFVDAVAILAQRAGLEVQMPARGGYPKEAGTAARVEQRGGTLLSTAI